MKKLTMLLFSILISFNSYSEWTKVTESLNNNSVFYIDIGTIKERNSYVYYWQLENYVKPDSDGDKSITKLKKADCDMVRGMSLSITGYSESMASGKSKRYNPRDEWSYNGPGTIGEITILYACYHATLKT